MRQSGWAHFAQGKRCKVKRKRYSRKFQRKAVERMRTCENIAHLAEELGVTPRCLYKWRRKLDLAECGEELARPSTHEAFFRKQAQQLKRLLARRHLRPNPGDDVVARQPEYRADV